MIFFKLLQDIKELLKEGNELKNSGFLINTEATAAALYGFFSALILILHDFGFDVTLGATDLHRMAHGWAITASFGYSIYRVITNAHAGLIRDPNLKEFIFFTGYTPEVQSNNLINIAHSSFAYANVYSNYFKGDIIPRPISW